MLILRRLPNVFIAELSHLHRGEWSLVQEMTCSAIENGAAAVKVQAFFPQDLSDEFKNSSEFVSKYSLTWHQHEDFVRLCRDKSAIPIVTAYDPKYIPELHKVGYRHIKIGSPDADDMVLIKSFIEMGFKVLLSTGGRNLASVARIHPLFAVFHCVSRYPADPNEANLARLVELRKFFPSATLGFSDHTDPRSDNWKEPLLLAKVMGAKIFEKHYTMSHALTSGLKDDAVAIEPWQLQSLVELTRLSNEELLNRYPEFGMFYSPQSNEERRLIEYYGRRWEKSHKDNAPCDGYDEFKELLT